MAHAEEIRPLELVDYLFFGYLTVIVFLLIVFGRGTSGTLWHLGAHMGFFAMGGFLLFINVRRSNGFIFFSRIWYIPFLYVFLFEEVGQIIHLVQPKLFDSWVLSIETKIFGGYPTVWLQRLANPWLTELMSLFYMSYYFLIPVLGLTLYFRHRWNQLNDLILTTSVTFFFCFLHYLLMPVAGPIFAPESLPFGLVSLEGGPLTRFEQWLFFRGAIKGGAFPSSHVAVAVVALFFSIRSGTYHSAFILTVTGLAVSTVYNGYHYGVDVLYGIVTGLAFCFACPFGDRLWRKGPGRLSRWKGDSNDKPSTDRDVDRAL
jgi:membrane-associated phospholipid phosphatase